MSRTATLARACLRTAKIAGRASPVDIPIFLAVRTVSEMMVPFTAIALAVMVDALEQDRTGAAALALGVYVAVFVGWYAVGLAIGPLQNRIFYRVMHAVRSALLQTSLRARGIEHLESPQYADRMRLVQGDANQAAVLFNVAANGLAFAFSLTVSLVAIAGVHPLLLAVLLGATVTGVVDAHIQRRAVGWWQRSAPGQRMADRLAELATGPAAAKEVRSFGLGEHLVEEHRRVTDGLYGHLARAERLKATGVFIGGMVRAGVLCGGLLLTSRLVLTGQISAGQTALAVTLLYGALGHGGRLAEMGGSLIRFGFMADQLLWLLDYDPPVTSPERPTPVPDRLHTGIELDSVSFRYPGTDRFVLHDITTTLRPGTTVAIVGENGAGKTTLVKLLCRLYDPTEGQVLVDGIDLRQLNVDEWRSSMTGAFQDFARLQVIARESVGAGDIARIEDVPAVSYPSGLEAPI